MFKHKAIVVGGGLAGLRAAIELAQQDIDVAVVSRVHPVRSHSGAAQGGINAPLGNAPGGQDDSPEKHTFDTIKGSDYLADQDAVEIMCREANERIIEMEHWGTPFSRDEQGKIAQRPFGGGGFPRTCYAADRTGHYLLDTLYEQIVKYKIRVYEAREVVRHLVKDGVSRGLIAYNIYSGEWEVFSAEAIIFATGGAGQLYSKSSNAIISDGSGMAIAYLAGVPLKDMEFIQFHPTCLYRRGGGKNILITEAARGEGGYLLNNKGERFMKNYAPKVMELAPRDIVSRAIQTEINQGRGFENSYVLLDLRHLGEVKIKEQLPGIREIAIKFAGIDPVKKPIPIHPAQHYTMGGIDTNIDGETEIKGSFAAGECACVSVHGANRLGGNSLSDTIVFGKRVGVAAARYISQRPDSQSVDEAFFRDSLDSFSRDMDSLLSRKSDDNPALIRRELQRIMSEKAGVFRNGQMLGEALWDILLLKKRYDETGPGCKEKRFNLALVRYLELGFMLELARAVVTGALYREESRGSHCRTDFPARDDKNFLKHTLIYYNPDGSIELEYKPVYITKFPPQARGY